MTGEIWLLTNPAPDAVLRSFQCAVCGKCHLREGVIAYVWDHPFVVTRTAALTCAESAGYTVPEWRKESVWYGA